jgi:hypothetical protein
LLEDDVEHLQGGAVGDLGHLVHPDGEPEASVLDRIDHDGVARPAGVLRDHAPVVLGQPLDGPAPHRSAQPTSGRLIAEAPPVGPARGERRPQGERRDHHGEATSRRCDRRRATRAGTTKAPGVLVDTGGFFVVGDTGIEPVTSSVSGKRATAAPIAQMCSAGAQLEVGTGFEPAWTALQAAASPLGHPTIKVHVWRSTRSVGYLFWRVAVFRRRQAPRADDEIRTRDPHLGKVMRYHCATSAWCDLSHTDVVGTALAATRKLYPVHAVSPKPVPFTGRVPSVQADRRGVDGPPGRSGHGRRARTASGCSDRRPTSATIDPHASAGGDWRSW